MHCSTRPRYSFCYTDLDVSQTNMKFIAIKLLFKEKRTTSLLSTHHKSYYVFYSPR